MPFRPALERFTPHTIVEPEQLRDRLRQVQLEGYAWTRDEYADGISSIAAPIPDEDGDVVAAVHIHGPTYRFPAPTTRSDAVLALIRCAGRIGTRLRGAGSSGS
jgi:DNA-binding IclR family transcriptional regulator